MAAQVKSGSTAMVVGTEVVLTADPETDDITGQFQADVSTLVAGEIVEFRIYEKINDTGDTYQSMEPIVAIAGMKYIYSPVLILLFGWKITAKQLNGTLRTIQWSVRTA